MQGIHFLDTHVFASLLLTYEECYHVIMKVWITHASKGGHDTAHYKDLGSINVDK